MNQVITVIFILLAAFILIAAVLTVTVRNLVHAALWLIAAFFGIGALYLLMEAEFIAVAQVLIYVGAIAILILFAIMLTPDIEGETGLQLFGRRRVALVVAAALFGVLIAPTVSLHAWELAPPPIGDEALLASARELGTAFMREYLLPFELASVLLLVALVGAITIALESRRQPQVLTLAEEFQLQQAQANVAEPVEVIEEPETNQLPAGEEAEPAGTATLPPSKP